MTGIPQVHAAGNVSVRLYEERDAAAAVRLMDVTFGGWPGRQLPVSPEEHLRWKLSSHAEVWRGQWVAEEGERLVGTHFCMIANVYLRGRPFLGSTGADSSVHPDYREQHLYTRLRETRFAAVAGHFDFTYSRGAHVAVNAARDRKGEPRFARDIELLERRLRPLGGARRVFRRVSALPAVERVERFDDGAEALWEAARTAFDAIVERLPERLNWRYADPRGGEAAILRVCGGSGAWRGYAVLRRNGTRAMLSDVLVLPGDGEALRALLFEVVATARTWGARIIRAWFPDGHPYRASAEEAGFRATGQAIDFRYKALDGHFEELDVFGDPAARIHLTMGDTDAG